jgi:hypothetical protein
MKIVINYSITTGGKVMSLKFKLISSFVTAALLMTACSANQNDSAKKDQKVDTSKKVESQNTENSKKGEKMVYAESFEMAVAELEKAKNGETVDFDKVMNIYKTDLQSLVKERDSETEDNMDQTITTALEAGKAGTMDKMVVKQIFDKLMQKVFFTTVRHDFKEVVEKWGNVDKVNKEIEEVKYFYAILKGTVQKRDTAYGTTMGDTINSGFGEIDKAITDNNQLAFQLGKQLVDKTLMKTFYYATGALPNGYATKIAKEAKVNATNAKVEQAEGWAFYQSLYSYMKENAEEEANYILGQFDLQTDVKTIDPVAINKAFIRGFAKTALGEYGESEENWGQDKSAITALEGAMFVDIISEDIKALLGDAEYQTLKKQTAQYLDAAKAKDDEKGKQLLAQIKNNLNTVIEKAK